MLYVCAWQCVARVGAAMSPLVLRSAMDMLQRNQPPSTSTSTPKEKRAHIPEIWPPGKHCDVCRKIIAIKYCTTCNIHTSNQITYDIT